VSVYGTGSVIKKKRRQGRCSNSCICSSQCKADMKSFNVRAVRFRLRRTACYMRCYTIELLLKLFLTSRYINLIHWSHYRILTTSSGCHIVIFKLYNTLPVYNFVVLGGLVVACLPLDPKFAGSNQVEDDGFLRAIKIRCATSFGGEVKPSVPCRKFIRYVTEPYEYEILRRQNSAAISSPHFSYFASRCLRWSLPKSSSGRIRNY
jgi:hypothetical protein